MLLHRVVPLCYVHPDSEVLLWEVVIERDGAVVFRACVQSLDAEKPTQLLKDELAKPSAPQQSQTDSAEEPSRRCSLEHPVDQGTPSLLERLLFAHDGTECSGSSVHA